MAIPIPDPLRDLSEYFEGLRVSGSESGHGNPMGAELGPQHVQGDLSIVQAQSSFEPQRQMVIEKNTELVHLRSPNALGPLRKIRDNPHIAVRATTIAAAISTISKQGSRWQPYSICERPERKNNTQSITSCTRCSSWHIECLPNPANPDGPCMRCMRSKLLPQPSILPWLRYEIHDTRLLDKGPHPRCSWTLRWRDMNIQEIEVWQSSSVKTITLTQDVGHGTSYDLHVREFVPLDGDCLVSVWDTLAGKMSHAWAPYAIASMRDSSRSILSFVKTHMETYLDHYVSNEDTLLNKTYQMALHHGRTTLIEDERVLLYSTLCLWVGCRMESERERISSEEVLGMTPQDWDPDAGNYGYYLVPPVMRAQIEILTTSMVLLPMKDEVLRRLQGLLEKNSAKSWFSIYLALFILLHNCSMLTRAQAARAARAVRYGKIPARVSDWSGVSLARNTALLTTKCAGAILRPSNSRRAAHRGQNLACAFSPLQ
ncbi:hypothetical protein F4778DRAFT_262846 [Xylariomycetidae sp. FL2044]|nr:hypothetical protein F4778DRAFT_262846 [Xylariomycetidae sp. FL2044]